VPYRDKLDTLGIEVGCIAPDPALGRFDLKTYLVFYRVATGDSGPDTGGKVSTFIVTFDGMGKVLVGLANVIGIGKQLVYNINRDICITIRKYRYLPYLLSIVGKFRSWNFIAI
jgi:hypothetical protein